MTWKHMAQRWPFALSLMVVGALVLAGCGGGSSTGSESSTTVASNAEGGNGGMEVSAEAKACLKEKGVELPASKGAQNGGPPMGEGGEPPENFEPPEGGEPPQGGEMPEGGSPGEGGPGGESFEKARKAFKECGVEMGGFKGASGKGGPNLNSAAFKKQIKEYAACVRENGYDLAEPNLSGEGPVFEKSESESAAFKQASAKCQDLLGGG